MAIRKRAPKVDAVLLSMEAECRRLEAATGPKEYRDRMAAMADEIRWKIAETPAATAEGMVFHVHSWFTNTDCADYFISNTALLSDDGCEILTSRTPETLIVR